MNDNKIDAIKASVDLRSFLESEGARFNTVGGVPRSDSCPCCGNGHKGNNKLALLKNGEKWRCFSCGKGGDVIDAASLSWSMTTRDAIKRLAEDQWVESSVKINRTATKKYDSLKEERQKALTVALTKLSEAIKHNGPVPHAELVNYLAIERGIGKEDPRIIAQAMKNGMLGFLPNSPFRAKAFLEEAIGFDLMIESGLWNPEKKMPAIAYRPIVFFMPGFESAEFRLGRVAAEGEKKAIRYGSSPRPWYWSGTDGSKVAVVEGAIDLLSLVAYGFQGDIIGIPGATVWTPEWLKGYSKVLTCLDPDAAGRAATAKILEACNSLGISGIDRTPTRGDINDMLLLKQAAS
jgi:DNA primase